VDNYIIQLPEKNNTLYRVVTLCVLLMCITSFSFVLFVHLGTARFPYAVAGVAGSFTGIIAWLPRFQNKKTFPLIPLLYGVFALLWYVLGAGWVAILFLLLAAAGLFARKKKIIKISAAGIQYPSFPPQFFTWKKIHRVLLKEDVLSIDLKDNHFYQFVLQPGDNPGLQQNEFNEFCNQQTLSGNS